MHAALQCVRTPVWVQLSQVLLILVELALVELALAGKPFSTDQSYA
jgi:hypothetical protein